MGAWLDNRATLPSSKTNMNPTDFRTPWNTLRSWPETGPIACALDLAPDAPSPGVVIANVQRVTTIDPQKPLESVRQALVASPERTRMLWLAYEAGHAIEPESRVRKPQRPPPEWRCGQVVELDGVLRFDAPGSPWAAETDPVNQNESGACEHAGFSIEPFAPSTAQQIYIRDVKRVLSLIRAGDVYQVNLTHRLQTVLHGSPRAFAAAFFETALPWHGTYIETTGTDGRRRVIVSASPELFLDFDPRSRTVRTRPMKGTRPATSDRSDLMHAEKDRAELNMIVDLMRNDLGSVCSYGSVKVDEPRTIECHGQSVLQATATVSGQVRGGLGLADVLEASFSPGSVTGTPKIRAMQIIDDLEQSPRGPYCGCMGLIDSTGRARLNVAIRTAIVTETDTPGRWLLEYPVGAGIVAESDPQSEWQETLDKAEVLFRLTQAQAPR
jgi:para-aminobenzoate synthetase component I